MAYTLEELARQVQGEVVGNPERQIAGAGPFEASGPEQITWAADKKFCRRILETGAGAVLVPEDFSTEGKDLIRVANPEVAFARILALFHPPSRPAPGFCPSARIGDGLTCGRDVSVGECAVIGHGVVLGDRVCIGAGVYIGDGVSIGPESVILPNVTILERCRIGARVIIHSGTVIGADGFGYASDGKAHHKLVHTGIVRIDDDVEIGACNTIDRAKFGETRIGKGVKTDNLVHVAHNVTVGERTLLVAQAGVAGSVTIGNWAIIAGQAAVAPHLTIGDGAIAGPKSGIGKDLEPGQVVYGSPALPYREWLKVNRALPRLPELAKQVADLRRRLDALEGGGKAAEPDIDNDG
jgi:UDP-3-O-[3-hydroxymyristoyl] glucosamine N-acyltransferase